MNSQKPKKKWNPVPEKFEQWLADYLELDQHQVELLLSDKTATRFLIAWSLFESRCFEGFARVDKFSAFATEVTENDAFRNEDFLEFERHFHDRYQNKRHYKRLMHKKSSKDLKDILSTQFDKLSDYQLIFMLLFVVYRFRNNIFHGNKEVKTWDKYPKQIDFCLRVMMDILDLQKWKRNNLIESKL